jgi:hypothetical protein
MPRRTRKAPSLITRITKGKNGAVSMAVYIDAVMYEFAEHRDQLSSNGSKAFEASKPNTGGIDARRTRSLRQYGLR